MRKITVLKEGWRFGKSRDAAREAISLPHTWNAIDGQDGGNDYHRGTCWYVRELTAEELAGDCVFLELNGAAMSADVYFNGRQLAHHDGGYSAFRVDVTAYLQDENLLCVTVDNSKNDRIYPQKADFTFYGGLYRDVEMIITPAEHFELVKDGTPGMKVTPVLKGNTAEVTVETWQNCDGPVALTVAGETL
jgi:beta-galactosidase